MQEQCDAVGNYGKNGMAEAHRSGFMAGTMKKAGYEVESCKPEGGERTYRINTK
jgi:hypothetical protein